MNYRKEQKSFYNLHMITTEKFKTITIQVNFKRKIKRDEITKRNMLINVLFDSTKKYPSRNLLEIETEELYGLKYRGSNYQSGLYTVMNFEINFLMDKYTENGMLNNAISFLREIIFNPNIENNSFNEDSFKNAYQLMKDYINSVEEDTPFYSQIKMLENMDSEAVFAYRSPGYIEDLEKINASNLYEYYLDVLENDIIDIFVVGNYDEKKISEIIELELPFKTINNVSESHFISYSNRHDGIQIYKESKNIKQSRLVLGALVNGASDFELRYVFMVYNYILGGSPDSKLFRNVREKNSLCYNISSSHQPIVSLLTVQAGINKDKFDAALELIQHEFKEMQDGNFEDSDIEKAKITYINSLEELVDNQTSIISLYSGIEYLDSDDIKTRIEKINKVTKEDIVQFAHKVYLNTVYLLEGDDIDDKENI